MDLGDGPAPHTFAETLEAWHADPTFTTDGTLRRERLRDLQNAMEAARCDPALREAIGEQLTLTFGSANITARFRSSSNAEDGALFNGAGLYDSYSGCYADDTDDDDQGPSLCDPGESKERTVCRALRKVWASLHNPKAYDERAFYGIDPSRVAMGVLVNERSEAEFANMVAFSGNPSVKSDHRFLVNAQIDELPVVSPTPGVWPEQTLLTIDADSGAVTTVDRVSPSRMLEPHETVLSDAQLRDLGARLAPSLPSTPSTLSRPPAAPSFWTPNGSSCPTASSASSKCAPSSSSLFSPLSPLFRPPHLHAGRPAPPRAMPPASSSHEWRNWQTRRI